MFGVEDWVDEGRGVGVCASNLAIGRGICVVTWCLLRGCADLIVDAESRCEIMAGKGSRSS